MKIVSDPPHWLSTTFQAEDQLYPSPVRNSIPMRHYFIPSSLVLTLLRHSFIKCPYEAETLSVVFQAEAPQIPVNSQWSTRWRHNQTEALFNQKMTCFKYLGGFVYSIFLKEYKELWTSGILQKILLFETWMGLYLGLQELRLTPSDQEIPVDGWLADGGLLLVWCSNNLRHKSAIR